MNSPFKAIIFDSSVFVTHDDTQISKDLADCCKLTPDEITENVFNDPRWRNYYHSYQMGKSSPEEFYRATVDRIKAKREHLSLEDFKEIWVGGFTEHSLASTIVRGIREDLKKILLVNMDEIRWKQLCTVPVVETFFKKPGTHTISHREGVCKPDMGIYTRARMQTKCKYWKEVLYVDTTRDGITKIQPLGAAFILCEAGGHSPTSMLLKSLREYGVLKKR